MHLFYLSARHNCTQYWWFPWEGYAHSTTHWQYLNKYQWKDQIFRSWWRFLMLVRWTRLLTIKRWVPFSLLLIEPTVSSRDLSLVRANLEYQRLIAISLCPSLKRLWESGENDRLISTVSWGVSFTLWSAWKWTLPDWKFSGCSPHNFQIELDFYLVMF